VSSSADDAQQERERRRRLAKVFGDVLPDDTTDEQDEGWGERGGKNAAHDDAWLKDQVPPHHGQH
jgi:hypothetical protein